MNYKNYLKSKHWKNKKKESYASKNYKCFFCPKRNNLQLHHITYENLGKELTEDLIYLCREHHTYVHKSGEKKLVQDYLEKIRRRNLNNKKTKYTKKPKNRWNKKNGKPKKYGFIKQKGFRTPIKNYAGLFTWKAEKKKNEQR